MSIKNIPAKAQTKPVSSLMALITIQLSLLAGTVFADQTKARDTIYFTLPPSPEVLASHLFGNDTKTQLTRSISFNKSTRAPKQPERSVTMPVLFHFGKTTITKESKPFLDNVGEMLISETYSKKALIVEGHTDSVGSTQYNQHLSEMRALAIRDYLVDNYDVDPMRLMPVGKGESALYNRINPKSAENRRVEFMPYRES